VGTGPALPEPGRDEDPVRGAAGPDNFPGIGADGWRLLPSRADGMDDPEVREAYLAALAEEDEPDDPDLYEDPDNAPPPGLDDAQLAALIAEAREVTADQARADALFARLGETGAMAAVAASLGRRGPGMPGSAQTLPGEYTSRSAGFATGKPLDVAPGCAALALFAEDAAGEDDCYPGATDDELLGAICAWDRVEAHASARKHAAVAELIRRRPALGCALEGQARMPEEWNEFTPAELAPALSESRAAAEGVLDLARDLAARLPGTRAAFRSGILSRYKAEIIACATEVLDAAEAAAAEALVLDRAGTLTPGGLRAAIARAIMEVAPDKARKRREQAAKQARVERWAEASGNAGLAGRELPPAEVLAADQRVTWWAKQLKRAGLDGGMDQLRARALMDILLGLDSRPGQTAQHGVPGGVSGPAGPHGLATLAPGGPLAGVIPPGFAGKVHLTVPLTTVLGLTDRPGEIPGIGPIDPDLARDLARAAARNPRTTWCVTVTDQDGHAIGHGCARPEPMSAVADQAKRQEPRSLDGHDPPRVPADAHGPGFSFAAADQHGPPGGYGTWRLATCGAAQPGWLVVLDRIAVDECDHRYEAKGHDPGAMLRHLTQIRHATCTAPTCRRPATQCDFEHNVPYEAGARTCECNGGPKCRYDHRLKQDPRWNVEQPSPAVIVWTTPAGRQYTTEPTRYPI
jgi:Domain of unknown function (DUF222)